MLKYVNNWEESIMFNGSLVALITPFDENNQIDELGIRIN